MHKLATFRENVGQSHCDRKTEGAFFKLRVCPYIIWTITTLLMLRSRYNLMGEDILRPIGYEAPEGLANQLTHPDSRNMEA